MLLTVLVSLLVAAGAVVTSAYLRYQRDATAAPPPGSSTTSVPPATLVPCRVEPCAVVFATTIGDTTIDLIADAGAESGRLKVGDDLLFESRITGKGVKLTPQSLVCLPGPPVTCLIRGEADGNLYGEVVLGRTGKWAMTGTIYVASGGYLSLGNVDGDVQPEVVAVQRGYFTQVWGVGGEDLGCTPVVTKPERLDGWPDNVKPQTKDLRKPCP